MAKKVYISKIDSPLGYHLAQFYRDDHLSFHPNTQIIGSSSSVQRMNGVHSIINFQKHPHIACKTILDCDLIILDLTATSHQAQIIMKFLKQVSNKLQKEIRIIGISNLLTWEGMDSYEREKQTNDKQKYMAKVTNQQNWKRTTYKDKDYTKRIPSYFAIFTHQKQNQLLQLNQINKIKTSVLATGVIYGKDNSWFHHQLLNALQNQDLQIFGKGKNILSFIHIQSLTKCIVKLTESHLKYAIARQNATYTQYQTKQIIKQATKNNRQFKQIPLSYLTENEVHWGSNILVQPTSIFAELMDSYNFKDYCIKHLLTDLCEYTKWRPSQAIIFTEDFGEAKINNIIEDAKKYKIINQIQIDVLNTQLISKALPQIQQSVLEKKQSRSKNNKQQKQPQVIMYKQAITEILSPLNLCNFICVVSTKMKQHISNQLFYKGNMILIVPNNEQNQNQIVVGSKKYYDFMKIDEPKHQNDQSLVQIVSVNVPTKQQYTPEQPKVDQKMVMTTQYVLDNVLVHLSQAKFQLKLKKQQIDIPNFLNELKTIWKKNDFISSIPPTQQK